MKNVFGCEGKMAGKGKMNIAIEKVLERFYIPSLKDEQN